MSYTYEKVSGNKAKLVFTVAAADFEAAVQKAYIKNRGKIQVPGFRKGKAPRSVIQTMYGKGVFYEDAVDEIFPDMYDEAVKAEKLEVVDRPSMTEINWDDVEKGSDLIFTIEVYVKPEITLGEYKGLTVEVEKKTVTEADVDARIKQDQEKVARTVEVEDRAVENGDTVKLDYAGTVDGVAFDGGTAQDQTLTIGSNQFIPGFEEQMIGMKIGEEKDLNVTFPEQYHAEDLAGKAAVFHVKVNGITVTEMPELDDDFAADVSDYSTFAEYKAGIEKELQEAADKQNDIAVENALVEKAADNAQMDIPEAMISNEQDDMVRDMEMRMMYQGIRMDDYLKYTGMTREQVKGMYRPEAAKRVKLQLTLEAIKNAESIEPTEEEIQVQVAEQAERMGQEVEKFSASLTEEQKGYLKDSAAIQKVIDMMKADCTVVEKKPEEKAEEAAE